MFETRVVTVGRSGTYKIYKIDDNLYLCKLINWQQYQLRGPGDLVLSRKGKKWESDEYEPSVVQSLGADIDQWEFNNRWAQ